MAYIPFVNHQIRYWFLRNLIRSAWASSSSSFCDPTAICHIRNISLMEANPWNTMSDTNTASLLGQFIVMVEVLVFKTMDSILRVLGFWFLTGSCVYGFFLFGWSLFGILLLMDTMNNEKWGQIKEKYPAVFGSNI